VNFGPSMPKQKEGNPACAEGYMEIRRRTQRGRPALTAALFAVCAFGSAPALAQLPVGPDITVPVPIESGTENSSPETTTTTTTSTTAPPPPSTTPPTTAAPASVPAPAPGWTTTQPPADGAKVETARRSGASSGRRAPPRARAASAEAETFDVAPVVAEDEPTIARLRQVSLPAARQFGFPLGLAVLVLLFLAVQGRLDARDPKLAAAPLSIDDDLLPFA
jgi:hypothetical protein